MIVPKDKREAKKAYLRNYYKRNRDRLLQQQKIYYEENKESIDLYSKEYYIKNKDKISSQQKEYRKENKDLIREYNNEYEKQKRKNNPSFRLRKDFSRIILNALKESGSNKRGKSVLDYLPYTIDELKAHLEEQFESWMTWENHGKHNFKLYDNNDSSTWTWNIDHIIPQSLLLYTSMEDENFQKCWALSNLRPLKAIENIRKSNKSS